MLRQLVARRAPFCPIAAVGGDTELEHDFALEEFVQPVRQRRRLVAEIGHPHCPMIASRLDRRTEQRCKFRLVGPSDRRSDGAGGVDRQSVEIKALADAMAFSALL